MFKSFGWPKQVILNTTTLEADQFKMTTFGHWGVNRLVKVNDEITPGWLKGKTLVGDTDSRLDKTQPIVITRTQMYLFGRRIGPQQYIINQGAEADILCEGKFEDYFWVLDRGTPGNVIPQNVA